MVNLSGIVEKQNELYIFFKFRADSVKKFKEMAYFCFLYTLQPKNKLRCFYCDQNFLLLKSFLKYWKSRTFPIYINVKIQSNKSTSHVTSKKLYYL